MRQLCLTCCLALGFALPSAVAAEIEVSLYYGQQEAPSSDIDIRGDSAIPDMSFRQESGAGISAPGVEVRFNGSDTFEYQITGLAVDWLAGVSYPLTQEWSVFGEYKGTYTQNEVDLVGGGTLNTDIFTNAVNIGVSYRF